MATLRELTSAGLENLVEVVNLAVALRNRLASGPVAELAARSAAELEALGLSKALAQDVRAALDRLGAVAASIAQNELPPNVTE